MSVKAVVKLRAHKGKGVALLAALTRPLEATRANPDCLAAGLFMGAQSPDELVMLEDWVSVEAHQRHLESLEAGATMDEVNELLAAPLQVEHFKRIEGE
jgi:quinol monooxygenase YgiN